MTDTKQPIDKRILGDQRIFQAVVNDLKMKHELVELADGTHRWVYTYDEIDPYELEDSEFSLTVQLIHQYGDTREVEGRIASIQLYMDTCEDQAVDPSWPTIHEFQDGQRAALAEIKKTKEESNDS